LFEQIPGQTVAVDYKAEGGRKKSIILSVPFFSVFVCEHGQLE
jgi:hypothetical protein